MPIPLELQGATHAVFCYTSDLLPASRRLQTFLGGSTNLVRVTLTSSGAVSKVDGPVDDLRAAAWLVGHGGAGDARISTRGGGVHIEMETVLDWCLSNGYYYVIDTCCEPNRRRLEAATYRGLDYYSAGDGHEVLQIVNYTSLDAWWTANGMALRSGPTAGGDEDDDL